MVKNTKGGNKGKKIARKNIISTEITIKTRLANPAEPCEMYATVTRLFGQGFCEVLCSDGKYRTCIIRKKFSGRNKRGNVISVDSKILVGTRDWEVIQKGKKEKCDLLEVYDPKQYHDIRCDPRSNWKLLQSIEEKRIGIHNFNRSGGGGGGGGSGENGDDIEDYDDGIDFRDGGDGDDGGNGNGDDETTNATTSAMQSMISKMDKRNLSSTTKTTTTTATATTTNPTFDLEGDINWDDI